MERKTLLKAVLEPAKRIMCVEHVTDGIGLFAAAEEAGVEGIVAKKAHAHYRRGRTSDWITIKTTAGKALVADRGEWNRKEPAVSRTSSMGK